MSAFALITGALFRAPEQKTAKSGKSYVVATVKVAADNAIDFWNLLAFGESAQAELLRLRDGDKIAAQGSPKVDLYSKDGATRINRTLFADHLLALRQPARERKAKASPGNGQAHSGRCADFDDGVPL